MNLTQTLYQGPGIDDPEILEQLPMDLRSLLEEENGFVKFGGGLHVRGACRAPMWHSLRKAMEGRTAFHMLYPDVVDATDIPFAQDCSGDQFLIRGGEVHQLAAEVGEIDPLDMDLEQFLAYVEADPVEALCMQPLARFSAEKGTLDPGKLLLAYPPFCSGQSGGTASLRDVDAFEVIGYHAELAKQIQNAEDGEDAIQFAP